MIETKSAKDHRGRVQTESEQQHEIIDVVIATKPFSPQEHRVDHAQAVNQDGKEEKMSICEPSHGKGAYDSAKEAQGAFRERTGRGRQVYRRRRSLQYVASGSSMSQNGGKLAVLGT